MTQERLFKVLNEDGFCYHGGDGEWHLPHDGQPGEWMPAIDGELVACENGYHLCRETDLLKWLGPAIFKTEYRGDRVDDDDKIVVREARLLRQLDTWNDRTARLFACDCASQALPIFEKQHPGDNRPRQAIEIARRYANGEATHKELDAAWAASWDAAWAARAAGLATARAASWDAARAASWDAAWAAARAARAATWDAARAAARAARAATWDAARAAARAAQTTLLLDYLGIS